MSLIHPQPRFGYDPATNLMFDYLTSRDVALSDAYQAPDGVWNLNLVKTLIEEGKPIDTAAQFHPSNQAAPPQPVTAGNASIVTHSQPPPPFVHPATGGLSSMMIHQLKFSPLQLAALGVSDEEAQLTGLTPEQVQAIGMTTDRANALNLTAEQRAALIL